MKNSKQASLRQLNQLVASKDSRAPYADLTNARHLMGDIEDGDFEDGDADYGDADYGDADYGDADYGDADGSPLATFDALIGDMEETGAPRRMGRRTRAGLAIGGGAVSGVLLGKALQRALAKRRARNKRTKSMLVRAGRRNSIDNSINARREMGKLPRNHQFRFFQVNGANLNSAQISPTESFVSDMLKHNFDRQQSDTPFEVEIVSGTFAGVTWTVTSVGLATPRYYVAVFVTIGINALAGNPGTIWNMTGILPTINGNLVITIPFSFTLKPGYYSKFLIYPWQIVTNKPLLALGQYSNVNPITFSITGLPSTSVVNMTIPGSQHVWTIAMRNRLL